MQAKDRQRAVFNQSCPVSMKEAVEDVLVDGPRNLSWIMRREPNSEKVVKQWSGALGMVKAQFIMLINTTYIHGPPSLFWVPHRLSVHLVYQEVSTTRLGKYILNFIIWFTTIQRWQMPFINGYTILELYYKARKPNYRKALQNVLHLATSLIVYVVEFLMSPRRYITISFYCIRF